MMLVFQVEANQTKFIKAVGILQMAWQMNEEVK